MKEHIIEGRLNGEGHRYAIVVARFNSFITEQLLAGALDGLRRTGAAAESASVFWVPGAWEIPLVADKLAKSGRFDGVICLGAVIRGSTPHFDYVAGHAASGIARVMGETGLPVIFGILTTDTIEQAVERAGTKMGNKGFEAAQAAVEMVNLLRDTDRHIEKLGGEG